MSTKLTDAGGEGEGIGQYVFGIGQRTEDGEGVEESMTLLRDLLINNITTLASTLYRKQRQSQITNKIAKVMGNQPP